MFSSLFSLHFSLFSKEQMRLFQIKDKREEIKEMVALLCKALNYIIIRGIIGYINLNITEIFYEKMLKM